MRRAQGLLPIFIHPQTALPASQDIRLGGNGDSYYEYLLKVGACSALCAGAMPAVPRRMHGHDAQFCPPAVKYHTPRYVRMAKQMLSARLLVSHGP